ncbi:MAG: hypothetical protein Q9P14_03650 [candidate division KSB1 bacterium]|nr:hypothetical protein [candidate division KSB1 bacterium]
MEGNLCAFHPPKKPVKNRKFLRAFFMIWGRPQWHKESDGNDQENARKTPGTYKVSGVLRADFCVMGLQQFQELFEVLR